MFPKMFAIAILFLSGFVNLSLAAQAVDINSADAATIAENLNGIGDAKARAIVAYRAEHGLFVDEQDLIKVNGIGAKLVERNRSLISFGKKAADSNTEAVEQTDEVKEGESSSTAVINNTSAASTEAGSQPQAGN